ncbi:MAG: hypothetical protein JW820_13835 [Spirochaetales bacterium]|nr:hypothetical protein [Spirochaetales bacterium]
MIQRRRLSEAQAEQAIKRGEFDELVTGAAPRVAVVLSQDWCGQWNMMDRYLNELAAGEAGEGQGEPGAVVYDFLYNRAECFQEFKSVKEGGWGNTQIPYVRYYRGGRLVGESNYVTEEQFLQRLGEAER